MAWFLLARVLFIAAVAYSALQLEPLDDSPFPNLAFGSALGVLIVLLEIRLKDTSVTHMLGALLGGAIGLGLAKTIGAALYWANLGSGRVVFLPQPTIDPMSVIRLIQGQPRVYSMEGPDKLRLRLELPDAASRLRTAKGLLTLLAKG